MSEEDLSNIIHTAYRYMSIEEFHKRFNLLRRIFSLPRDSKVIQFHHSFGEWFLDVKHCTRRFLCSANEGHAMIAMHYTMRYIYYIVIIENSVFNILLHKYV